MKNALDLYEQALIEMTQSSEQNDWEVLYTSFCIHESPGFKKDGTDIAKMMLYLLYDTKQPFEERRHHREYIDLLLNTSKPLYTGFAESRYSYYGDQIRQLFHQLFRQISLSAIKQTDILQNIRERYLSDSILPFSSRLQGVVYGDEKIFFKRGHEDQLFGYVQEICICLFDLLFYQVSTTNFFPMIEHFFSFVIKYCQFLFEHYGTVNVNISSFLTPSFRMKMARLTGIDEGTLQNMIIEKYREETASFLSRCAFFDHNITTILSDYDWLPRDIVTLLYEDFQAFYQERIALLNTPSTNRYEKMFSSFGELCKLEYWYKKTSYL